MKILFVASDNIPHIGGKSTHILDLRDGLESNAVDCNLISLSSLGKKQLCFLKMVLIPLRLINKDLYVYSFGGFYN